MYQYYTIASSVQLSEVRWFLEEDNGEVESVKCEMMVASSMICNLTPHRFVICDRKDKGVDSLLYTIHASKDGRKRRELAFSVPSINQLGSFGSIFLALAAPSTMVQIDAKSYFHIWLHIVDALNRTTWFFSCVLSIQILIILIYKIIVSRLVKRR